MVNRPTELRLRHTARCCSGRRLRRHGAALPVGSLCVLRRGRRQLCGNDIEGLYPQSSCFSRATGRLVRPVVRPNARGGALNASYGLRSAGNRLTGLVGDDKRELLADVGRGRDGPSRPGGSDAAVGRVRGAVRSTPDGGRPTLGFALMTQPHRQPVPCRDDHRDASTRAAMVG
jgi:hypothetical protein